MDSSSFASINYLRRSRRSCDRRSLMAKTNKLTKKKQIVRSFKIHRSGAINGRAEANNQDIHAVSCGLFIRCYDRARARPATPYLSVIFWYLSTTGFVGAHKNGVEAQVDRTVKRRALYSQATAPSTLSSPCTSGSALALREARTIASPLRRFVHSTSLYCHLRAGKPAKPLLKPLASVT